MNNSKRLIIVGCGDLAKELLNWMIESNLFEKIETKLFFIDDLENKDFYIKNIKIICLGKINEFVPRNGDKLYLGIADPKSKFRIIKQLDKNKAEFNSFIHPSAIISPTSKIGRGCIVFPYSVCSNNSQINDFVTVNLHSAIGHDVLVDSFSTISSFVDLTGYVNVGEKVLIGSGAKFLPKVKIGKESTIGAGAIIFKSIPNGKTAYCNPARIL